ncbi:MAG TPA: hypothetical protein VIK98_10875 [Limnochordales bacterium]|nr:hypothetical protein [Bacillota bacterium]
MSRIKKRLVLTRTDGTIIRIRRRRGTARSRTTFDTAPELPPELAPYATDEEEQPTATGESPALEAESMAEATEAAAQVTETSAEATGAPAEAADAAVQATDGPAQVTGAAAQVTEVEAQVTEAAAPVAETAADVTESATRVTETAAEVTETAAEVTETAAQVTKASTGPAESPLRAAAAPADLAPGLPRNQPFRDELGVRGLRTTGLFAVPDDSIIQLVILISSFADQEQTANVWVRRVEDDELRTVFFRSLTVPAGGVQQVTVDGLGGQTVRIDVELPSDLLVPTASVTQYFLADGAIIVRVYKSPADFVPV